MRAERGLLDTSVFVARESGRPLDAGAVPVDVFVSVITIAELQAGVHSARDVGIRARRLQTLDTALRLNPLPLGLAEAGRWAQLRVQLADAGRRANVNDLWVAAVALANDLPVITQDDDFDVLAEIAGLEVVRV